MRSGIIVIMVAAVLVSVPAWAPPAFARDDGKIQQIDELPRKIRVALFTAQEYVQGVNYPEAVKSLREFLEDNPGDDHFWLRFFLGEYLSHLERIEEAAGQMEKCVEMEPRFPEGWLKLGELAYSLGRFEQAGEAIERGHELSDEKRPELLYFAAASFILAQQSERALPLLDELISGEHGEPRFEWYRAMVSASIDAQALDKGQQAVDSMLETYTGNPDAWYLAFQYAASTGDYEQAAVALTVVSYLRPLTRQEQIQLGDLYSAVDVPAVASDFYRSAMADSASSREIERLASAYIASYDHDAALQVLTRAVQKEPTARLYSLLGDLQFMRKDYAASYDAFAECARLDPDPGRPYLMMGYCAMELERNREAVDALTKAIAYEDIADRAQSLLERARRRIGEDRAQADSQDKENARGGGSAATAQSGS